MEETTISPIARLVCDYAMEQDREFEEINNYMYRYQYQLLQQQENESYSHNRPVSVDDLLTEDECERPIHEQLLDLRHDFIAKYGIMPTHVIINHEDYRELRMQYEYMLSMPAVENPKYAGMDIKVVHTGEPHVGILMN